MSHVVITNSEKSFIFTKGAVSDEILQRVFHLQNPFLMNEDQAIVTYDEVQPGHTYHIYGDAVAPTQAGQL